MAVYRPIQISYWQDKFVLNLTPEEKFFYLYLMTNSKTTQCGIYELPMQVVHTETGYNNETIKKLLVKFTEYKKIKYDFDNEIIFILNWHKYNGLKNINNAKCVIGELQKVKNSKFIREYTKKLGQCEDYKNINLMVIRAYKPLTTTETKTESQSKEETKEKPQTENWGGGFLNDKDLKHSNGEYCFNLSYDYYPKKSGDMKSHVEQYRNTVFSIEDYNRINLAILYYKDNMDVKTRYQKNFTEFLKCYKDFL